jgi:hypothetical protein
MPIDDLKITVSGLTTTIQKNCTTPTSKWITVMKSLAHIWCLCMMEWRSWCPHHTFEALDEVEALDLFSYLLASLIDLSKPWRLPDQNLRELRDLLRCFIFYLINVVELLAYFRLGDVKPDS